MTQQTHSEAVHDTVIETVTLTLYDTIRETTTITIQTNETGDTTRLTTTCDREKSTSRDRTANHSHRLTQTERDITNKETSKTPPINPIHPISLKSPMKIIAIALLLGLLIPIIKLIHCQKK